jgi:iron-sulfur cluster protein
MNRSEKAAAIRHLLNTEGASVHRNTTGFNRGRYESVARLSNYEELKGQARQIKEDAIARLPELIRTLQEQVEAHGGSVYLAADATDANRYIERVCRSQGARRVAKSKSMTSEEIHVNEALHEAGIEVVETDLGEWVLQLANERPSHLVAPAIHKSRSEIARLFNERFAPDPPLETAEELTRFARNQLGTLIRDADVGMTGANFIAAATGTLCLVTSEGNARKSVHVPPVYIAVAGVEKIVPSVEDLAPFLELIGRSGTGQDLTSYVSLFTPPFRDPAPRRTDENGTGNEEPRERAFHLVLIDNGRLQMREDDQLRETLYCIRCGACSNVCANFQHVGGHAFGGQTYSGGIATGWEAGVNGLDVAATFNDLCTGCTRCVPACPVGIDIPWLNVVVRSRINRTNRSRFDWVFEGLMPEDEPGGLDLAKRFFGHFEIVAALGSTMAPVSNRIAAWPPVRRLMEAVLSIDRRRALPAFTRDTLQAWFNRRTSASNGRIDREVVLYPDVFTNYIHTARGKAAVRVLEALGARVHLPSVGESGRAPLSQGMIKTATKKAQAVYRALKPHLDAGHDVVVIEPSDLAMFRRDYEKLLPAAAFTALRQQSVEVMDYVGQRVEQRGADSRLRSGNGEEVAYHSHCQQRTLGLEAPTVTLLQALGYQIHTSTAECCGMAGSFGYKSEYYELSMRVGQQLQEEWEGDAVWARRLVASGSSCQEQLNALSGRPVQHPIELIAPQP